MSNVKYCKSCGHDHHHVENGAIDRSSVGKSIWYHTINGDNFFESFLLAWDGYLQAVIFFDSETRYVCSRLLSEGANGDC
jgi:hypothetical protein